MVQSKRTPRISRISPKDVKIVDGLRRMGLTDYEIRVYLGILRHPGSRIPEISGATGVPQPKVYGTIRRLIERGLCESQLGPVNTYTATPPKNSFVPLLDEIRGAHEVAREIVKDLQKEHSTPSDSLAARGGRIKLFQGKQATTRNFRFLLAKAEKEVALVARLPLIVRDDDEAMEQAISQGARVRVLLELAADFDPASEQVVERQLALGFQSRRVEHVPMRMAIFDRRIALLPMHEASKGKEGSMMLEIRNEGLAEGLLEVFEVYWQQARPIELARKRK